MSVPTRPVPPVSKTRPRMAPPAIGRSRRGPVLRQKVFCLPERRVLDERLFEPAHDDAFAVTESRLDALTENVLADEHVRLVEPDHGSKGCGPGEPGVDLHHVDLPVHEPALDVKRPAGPERAGDPLARFAHLR